MYGRGFWQTASGVSKSSKGSMVFALVSILTLCASFSCGGSGASSQNTVAAGPQKHPRSPAAACDNPYYPAGSGGLRTYRISNRGTALPTLTYSEQRANVSLGSFTDHREFSDGIKTDAQWFCTSAGLESSEFAIPVVMRLSGGAITFNSIRPSGPAIPTEDKWTPGYQWTTNYDVTGSENNAMAGSPDQVAGTIEVKNQIVSSEKVTVPAGAFDCLLVDSTIRSPLRVETSQGATRPSLVSIRVSAWYAKGVGLVRAAFSGDIGTGGEELISITQ